MVRNALVVAALLLTFLPGIAAAAEDPEHPSKNAQKLLATLDKFGINSKEVKEFVATANAHVSHGYVNFAEKEALGGKFAFRYALSRKDMPMMIHDRLQLSYTPNNSHFQCIITTHGIGVSYHLTFK